MTVSLIRADVPIGRRSLVGCEYTDLPDIYYGQIASRNDGWGGGNKLGSVDGQRTCLDVNRVPEKAQFRVCY